MRFGRPAALSIIVGTALAFAGWASAGAPTPWQDVLALILVIPFWAIGVRIVIFVGQWLNRRGSSN